HTIPLGQSQVDQMVSQAVRLIGGWHSPATLDASLARLHAVLVAPLSIPDDVREVIVVPDGPLRLVPFASLRDSSGRFLVERQAVVASHSLASLMRALEHRRTRREGAPVKALVVGDPKFDAEQAPRVPDLPFAARE